MKKQQETTLYLAYGSNLNLSQMARRCPTARQLDTTVIPDYGLVFRGARNGAVATIEPCKGKRVPVLAWELKPLDELALDHYEGYPHFYEKRTHTVELGGKPVEAMVYEMTPGHVIGIPAQAYYEAIREGYESAGFDVSALDEAVIQSAGLAMRESREEMALDEAAWQEEIRQQEDPEYDMDPEMGW